MEVDVTNTYSIESYTYELRQGGVVKDHGQAATEAEMFTISLVELIDRNYQLRVRTVNGCHNDGFGIYTFNIEAGKKPSPVVCDFADAELTGVDRNLDSEINMTYLEVSVVR